MAPERPGTDDNTPETLDSPSTEAAPREETVWETLTKERIETFHSWLNRVVFNQIRYYKRLAEIMVHPKKPKIKENPSKPLSYEDRLKEYNSFYRIWQYFHAIQIPYWLYLCSQQNNGRAAPLLETSAVIINTLLAFHIAYNRRRVKRIIDAVEKRDERREEKAEERERRREKNRKRKERRKGRR